MIAKKKNLLIPVYIAGVIIVIYLITFFIFHDKNNSYALLPSSPSQSASPNQQPNWFRKNYHYIVWVLLSLCVIVEIILLAWPSKKKSNKKVISGPTGQCSNQNANALSTFTPGKSYYISFCSLASVQKDSLGKWYCASGYTDDVKSKSAIFLPTTTTTPEMIQLNLCDFYCNNYNQTLNANLYNSCAITSNKPLGFGEYSVWIKNSTVKGVISTFYLSKQFKQASDNTMLSNGQAELDWEVTSNPSSPTNSLIADTNIYYYQSTATQNRCDDNPASACAQPDTFSVTYDNGTGWPSANNQHDGALQYIIGFHKDSIEFKLVDSSYRILYVRIIDLTQQTDTATVKDVSGKVLSTTNYMTGKITDANGNVTTKSGWQRATNTSAIKTYYADESILYPFFNIWCPGNDNWLLDTIGTPSSDNLYNPTNADTLSICPLCTSVNTPSTTYSRAGSQSFYYGPMMFIPDTNNTIFKPSDWYANI